MIAKDTIEFLKKVPPLDLLSDKELEEIAQDISLEYYPSGSKVLLQDGPPSAFLRIIKKGGVKVYFTSEEGKEITLDYRSEGDHFGLLSLVSGDRSRTNVVTVEDTICLLISRAQVMNILQQNPKANEYFLKSFFISYIDKTYDETRKRYSGIASGGNMLYATPVGDLVRKSPLTAPMETSIHEAATIMAQHKTSSLVIIQKGFPVGIITDRDLRTKVVAARKDLAAPVRDIMNAPLITVDSEELCFEALLLMMRRNIHHLVVMQGGALKGVVTNHDFMLLQGSSPTAIVKEVAHMQGPEALGMAVQKLHKATSTLLMEGAKAYNVTGFITELVEKIVKRLLDMHQEAVGGPPMLKYSVFFIGPAARRELTLDLPFKLCVAFEETSNLTQIKQAEDYFKNFAAMLSKAFTDCNCVPQGQWLDDSAMKSMGDWKESFERWALNPAGTGIDPDFIEMRAIRGDERPVVELREHLLGLISSTPALRAMLIERTVENRPPLGFFKRFVVEKSGEHKNELDLYDKGVRPLAEAVRILALEGKLPEQSTAHRVAALKRQQGFVHADDAMHAFDYLLDFIIHTQLGKAEKTIMPDAFINPETISNMERKNLRGAFQLAATLYDEVEALASKVS